MKTHHRPGRFTCRPSLAHVSKEQHIEVRSGKKDQNNAIYLAVRVAAADSDAAAASAERWRQRAAMPNHYFPFLFLFIPVLSAIQSCASVRKNEREILVMHELNQFHATKFYRARSISFQHHLVTRQMRAAAAAAI